MSKHEPTPAANRDADGLIDYEAIHEDVRLTLREKAIDAIVDSGSPLSRAEISSKLDEFIAESARAMNAPSDQDASDE